MSLGLPCLEIEAITGEPKADENKSAQEVSEEITEPRSFLVIVS